MGIIGAGRCLAACIAIAGLQAPAMADEPAPVPAVVAEGVATVRAEDLVEDPATGLLRAEIAFPDRPSGRRLLAARTDNSPAGLLLAQMLRRGAAGNHGDLYDNRDRGHSRLAPDDHPSLTFTAYDEAARARSLDYGLNLRILFGTITIGNSSTAVTSGPFWRSQPRLALTTAEGPPRLAALHDASNLYVYPSHQDHGPTRGDLYPAQTPYMVISQGSSGSDRPFLRAFADALAAMRPDTKALLREKGLGASTLQMLLRRSMAGIETDADYLSPRAHPTVVDGAALRRDEIIRLANALRADSVPPAVRLAVLSEPELARGVGLFGEEMTERLFDTPGAVARIARGVIGVRRYRLSVAGTADPNGRPLVFHWRVLRGRAVAVEPLDAAASTVEVTVGWHEPYPADGAEGLSTHRIDVAVFADNGAALSAPAFFSVAFPPAERRSYGPNGQPVEIDYAPADLADRYADPAVFAARPWRDSYRYGADGSLLGWHRLRRDGSEDEYTRHGLRVLTRDAQGRPLRAQLVGYIPQERPRARRLVVEVTAEVFGEYRYAGPDDLLGEVEVIGLPAQE